MGNVVAYKKKTIDRSIGKELKRVGTEEEIERRYKFKQEKFSLYTTLSLYKYSNNMDIL